MKVTFSENLYISESMKPQKLDKLKKNVARNPAFTKVFLLTLPTNPENQLDIIESGYLVFPYYNTHPIHVIGIAATKGEALVLVQKLMQECLEKRGDTNIKAYLTGEDDTCQYC